MTVLVVSVMCVFTLYHIFLQFIHVHCYVCPQQFHCNEMYKSTQDGLERLAEPICVSDWHCVQSVDRPNQQKNVLLDAPQKSLLLITLTSMAHGRSLLNISHCDENSSGVK